MEARRSCGASRDRLSPKHCTTITRQNLHVLSAEALKETNGMSRSQTLNSLAPTMVQQKSPDPTSFIPLSDEKRKPNHWGTKCSFSIIMARALFLQHNIFMGTKITFYLPPGAVLLPTHKSEQSTSLSIESNGP